MMTSSVMSHVVVAYERPDLSFGTGGGLFPSSFDSHPDYPRVIPNNVPPRTDLSRVIKIGSVDLLMVSP